MEYERPNENAPELINLLDFIIGMTKAIDDHHVKMNYGIYFETHGSVLAVFGKNINDMGIWKLNPVLEVIRDWRSTILPLMRQNRVLKIGRVQYSGRCPAESTGVPQASPDLEWWGSPGDACLRVGENPGQRPLISRATGMEYQTCP
ncbi:hypothetical protein CQW23_09200 [Capsicum baccatum]|uniref:Uncharacterized protein n=1 Tax=Capsicum baccatum TaxID=33114 RepID=A0A2G2WW45_CAPBA|nr:hypothetical protein CQW23_09200 [Capsicum baccatum]